MTLAAHVQSGRRFVEGTLIDTVEVTRAAALGTLDLDTLAHAKGLQTVYTGRGRVRAVGDAASAEVGFGEGPVTLRGYLATLPWDAPDVQPQDRLRVTASADPRISGRSFRVVSVEVRSAQVFRRLTLEDDDRG